MRWLRLILGFPFGLLYGAGAGLRRLWFDRTGRRHRSSVRSIVLGNLTVGGTGKTPMAIFVATHAPEPDKIAVLSRGYGRRTRGFLEVQPETLPADSGDEPAEMRMAVAESRVFVCEDRLEGISRIAGLFPACRSVVLDDAWQHLPLKADRYVLLCDYNRPFVEDWPMPAGLLREFRSAAKGADAIVVTKCPADLSLEQAMPMSAALHRYTRQVFFASYENAAPRTDAGQLLESGAAVIIVSALADNAAFRRWCEANHRVMAHFSYRDHHAFTASEASDWQAAMAAHQAAGILTTRKDYMRMKDIGLQHETVFYTATEPKFLFNTEDDFIRILF